VKHPRTVEEHVVVFLREWSLEMPTTLHRHEVFFGPPDRPGRETLGASDSTATELVGGSLLGSPAYAEPVRHLLEDDNPHREEPAIYEGSLTVEKHLATPLRSAMRRCGRMMEAYLVEVARSGGDWLSPAQRRGCYDEHIARVYANEAFRRLWREYSVDRPTRLPKRQRERHHSDDVPWLRGEDGPKRYAGSVPWTQLSESEQRAIEAEEAAQKAAEDAA
jgi:hypothetical protein